MRILRFAVCYTIAIVSWAQSPDGRTTFQSLCSGCHGADGNGGEHAPSIVTSPGVRSDDQLAAIIHDGLPLKGMPASSSCRNRNCAR
jgi:alcohol dehydrogenase (cytochrome c)